MCTGLEVLAAGTAIGGLATQHSQAKRAREDRKKAAKQPVIDPVAEKERQREKAVRARQKAKGGFGTSDTLKGTLLGSTSSASNTLLGQ